MGRSLDLVDGLEKIVGPLEREVRGLDGHQHVGRRHQRIDREQPKGRRRVDDDRVEVGLEGLDGVLEPIGGVEFTGDVDLELGHGDPGRRHPKVFLGRRHDDIVKPRGRPQDVVHVAVDLVQIDVGHGRVGLRVEIDEQCFQTLLGQTSCEIDGSGGFAHTTFLIRNGDPHEVSGFRRSCDSAGPTIGAPGLGCQRADSGELDLMEDEVVDRLLRKRRPPSHFVFAHVLRTHLFQKLANRLLDRGCIEDPVFEDHRIDQHIDLCPEGDGDGVGRP